MKRLLVSLFLVVVGCGAKSAESTTPAGGTDSKAEQFDRKELCERAVSRAVEIMRDEQKPGAVDERDVEASRSEGVRDCIDSETSRANLECVMRARVQQDLVRCAEQED